MKLNTGQIAYEGEGLGNGAPPAPPPAPPAPAAPPAHPVAPWQSDTVWNLGEGEAAKPWYEAIPEEEVRASVAAKGYKNPGELAIAYSNLMKMQRNPGDVLTVPPADATPEQTAEFYKKLGRPDTADAYQFTFPEGVQVDESMVGFGKTLAHELGLNPKQAQTLASKWTEFAASQNAGFVEAENARNETEMASLKTKFGDQLDTMKSHGLNVVKALGPSAADLITRVEAHIGSAAVVELLAEIGKRTAEGSLKGDGNLGDPNNPANMSKEAATAKVAELRANPEFDKKYNDKAHPEHEAAVQLMVALMART